MRVVKLNGAQRIVLVVALALALGVLGLYLTSLGGASTGWVAYTPLTSDPVAPHVGLYAWARMLIWIGFIVLWMFVSWVVFRSDLDRRDRMSPEE